MVPIDELDGRVLRLVKGSLRLDQLEEIADRLRRKGVPVAFNFVPPMAVVIKSQGGAEPAARSWGDRPVGESSPSGVRVAVVDTGVTRQERTDGWLTGTAREAAAGTPATSTCSSPTRTRRRRSSCWTRPAATAPRSAG